MATRFRGFLPVIIDVETGGLDARRNALLQLAWMLVRFDDQGRLVPGEVKSAHVIPYAGSELDPEALRINGIDPEDPDRGALDERTAIKMCFDDVRKEIKAQGCNRAVLVGHNAFFDHAFIRAAVARQDIKRDPFHPFSTFDTCTLAALATGQTVLATACRRLGMEFDGNLAHEAAYDTERTAELFCRIVNLWDGNNLLPTS